MESVNGKYFGPVDDPEKAAYFDTAEEAAKAYDIFVNELFKRLNKEKVDAAFGTNVGIAGHSDEVSFDKAMACTRCGGLVFTTFTFRGDEKFCWDCFDKTRMALMKGVELKEKFEGWENLRFVAEEAETLDDVITALEQEIATLKEMDEDGVYINLDPISEGLLFLTTDNPEVALKWGFETSDIGENKDAE